MTQLTSATQGDSGGALPTEVQIGKTSYSILEIPDAGSEIVRQARAQLLTNLDLDKLIEDLSLCSDLIYLAASGIKASGRVPTLEQRMTTLHHDFAKLCQTADLVLNEIALRSSEIQTNLLLVVEYLSEGDGAAAVQFLEECAATAGELATKASTLSTNFEALSTKTSDILGETSKELALGHQEAEEIKRQVRELEAKVAKANSLLKSVGEQKAMLEEKYQEAVEKAEKTEERAFALSIVGAIMKPIAAGIGTFAAVYAGGAAGAAANKLAARMPSLPPNTKAEAEDTVEKSKKALSEAEGDLKTAGTKAGNAEEAEQATSADHALKVVAVAEAEARAKSAPSPQANAALQTALDERKIAKRKFDSALDTAEKAQAEKKSAEEKVAQLQVALKAAGEALTQAGEALQELGDNYAAIAEGYRSEKREYLRLLIERQDLERSTLGDIQYFAVKMKNAGPELKEVNVACDSLFLAVGALKKISVILMDASKFWANMDMACKSLARSNLKTQIKAKGERGAEEQKKVLSSNIFKKTIVQYFAGWRALEVVSLEYGKKASEVRDSTLKDFESNLTIEQARIQVRELGAKLNIRTEATLAANEEVKTALVLMEQQH
jgi:hypothetical protein